MKVTKEPYSPYDTDSFKNKGCICPMCGRSAKFSTRKGRNKSKCENDSYRHFVEGGVDYIYAKK